MRHSGPKSPRQAAGIFGQPRGAPMAAVNVAEEVLAGVLQAAELLQGAVVAAQAGPLESLRWAGALPLLLRDLRVPRIVSADALLRCESRGDVRRLLAPSPWSVEDEGGDDGDQDADGDDQEQPEEFVVERLVLLLQDFLWDYEPALRRLLAMGAVAHLTVCSSLSERAHECYDFSKAGMEQVPGARAAKTMVFDEFAAALSASHKGKARVQAAPERSPKEIPAATEPVETANEGEEDWDWTDDNDGGGGEETAASVHQRKQSLSQAFTPAQITAPKELEIRSVRVVHLPLNATPLLSKKTMSAEPSLFVLSHPICASAFPLMMHQVEMSALSSTTTAVSSTSVDGRPKHYTQVKDVQPEHIPSSFRRSLRLLAHLLGELLTRARLDVKERIYTMGATSIKIGHTLLRILNELEEEGNSNAQIHDEKQPASIIIIDRTCDLVGPCSFGVSLLDRVLALLPQSPDPDNIFNAADQDHHISEIYPVHGCDPVPQISIHDAQSTMAYQTSPFVSQIAWNGGVSLAHPPNSTGEQIFRSLAFQPAKLALRDLDRRLQIVEHGLVQQGKITKSSSVRKPGEKKPSTRGRDVVQRRIKSILEAGEPASVDQSALVELGIIILETLERIESGQQDWDKCRERASRQRQLNAQNAGEWIIPELADSVQRQLGAPSPDLPTLVDLLTLLVQGFALSSRSPPEDFTIQMLSKVMSELLIKTSSTGGTSRTLFPEFYDQISQYISEADLSTTITSPANAGGDEDDWNWTDDIHKSPKAQERNQIASTTQQVSLEAREIADTCAQLVVERLKECGHECAQLSCEGQTTDGGESSSLVAQLCRAVLGSSQIEIPQLQHIVDVSEQLTRAGIDLLKSGFSRFGFGVGSNGGASNGGNRRVLGDAQTLIVFVVGGITFEEVQEVHNTLQDMQFQVILGGTTITNNRIILEQVFK